MKQTYQIKNKSFWKGIVPSAALITGTMFGLGSSSCSSDNNTPGSNLYNFSDSGAFDGNVPDDNDYDGGIPDSEVPDSSIPDSGAPDSNIPDGDVPDSSIPDEVNLKGSVQKGPFIQGSDIQIYLLDEKGNNLGSVYNTQTSDNLGNFSTTLAGLSENYTGNLSLSGNGFFFKEVAGVLSNAPQTLKALYNVDGNAAEIHLNSITHLSYLRAMKLLKENSDLDAAVSQAHNELVASLKLIGLVYPADATELGAGMNLFGENIGANNYLLAVSCALENAAESSDSALQELLNTYQADLANDGVVNPELNAKIRKGVANTNPTICVTNLQKRAQEVGELFNLDVAGVNGILDTDLDGIVNSKDSDLDGDGIDNDKDAEPYNPKVIGVPFCKDYLCWEVNPSTEIMTLTQAAEYCKNLTFDGNNTWRVPNIFELVTLIKGCPDSESEGECGKYFYKCNSSSCTPFEGPGKDGCYWDPLLEGKCGSYNSIPVYSVSGVDFTQATWYSFPEGEEQPGLIRCVRKE